MTLQNEALFLMLLCHYTENDVSTKVRVMIKFCKSKKGQKQSFADVLQNRCSEKFHKFHRKKPVFESLLNKVAGLKACNFIKKRLQYKCFLMKFRKFLRTPFSTEHLWWQFLEGVCKGTSLVKILHSCHFDIFGINYRCFRKMPIKKNNE